MDWALIVLPLVTFATAALTGIIGMGGGLLLLLVMAEFLSFAVLIPVHGINQLITHFSRASVSYQQINLRITLQFAGGSVIGAALGTQFALSVSEQLFKLLLGFFVLLCLVLPKNGVGFRVKGKWPMVGAFSSFFGLFVGATGVLIAPFYLNESLNKEQLVATKAACQVFIHASKVIAFFLLGFALGPYLLLVILMGIMSFSGSYIAKHLLARIPDSKFDMLFKLVIVILAARQIFIGIKGLV